METNNFFLLNCLEQYTLGSQSFHIPGQAGLKQLSELIRGHASIVRDTAHGIGVNRIMAGDRKNSQTIRHDNVLPLSNDTKTCFFQDSYSVQMINPGYFPHGATLLHLFPERQSPGTNRLQRLSTL